MSQNLFISQMQEGENQTNVQNTPTLVLIDQVLIEQQHYLMSRAICAIWFFICLILSIYSSLLFFNILPQQEIREEIREIQFEYEFNSKCRDGYPFAWTMQTQKQMNITLPQICERRNILLAIPEITFRLDTFYDQKNNVSFKLCQKVINKAHINYTKGQKLLIGFSVTTNSSNSIIKTDTKNNNTEPLFPIPNALEWAHLNSLPLPSVDDDSEVCLSDDMIYLYLSQQLSDLELVVNKQFQTFWFTDEDKQNFDSAKNILSAALSVIALACFCKTINYSCRLHSISCFRYSALLCQVILLPSSIVLSIYILFENSQLDSKLWWHWIAVLTISLFVWILQPILIICISY